MKRQIRVMIIILLLIGYNRTTAQGNDLDINSLNNQLESSASAYMDEVTGVTSDVTGNMKDYKAYLPILMFHHIQKPGSIPYNFRSRLSFAPKSLEQFLMFFKQNNIQTLTFRDLKDILEGKKQFPSKAVMLTFDDGYADQYQNAFPLLKKYNMKGVFFIISKYPGNDPGYMTWNQIKEMSDNGQEIGSHTVSHLDLASLSDKKIAYELETSKEVIEDNIGKPVISFCYPSGEYNKKVIKITKADYLFARTTNAGKIFSVQKRYELPTVRISPTTGIRLLKNIFNKKIATKKTAT